MQTIENYKWELMSLSLDQLTKTWADGNEGMRTTLEWTLYKAGRWPHKGGNGVSPSYLTGPLPAETIMCY